MTDKQLLEQALAFIASIGPAFVCGAAHHKKKEQHGIFEPCPHVEKQKQVYDAIRARLEQPEQESVAGCACRWDAEGDRVVTCQRHQGWLEVIAEWADRAREAEAKLKATPPAAQEEIQRLSALVRAQQITIDKLEAAPVQEPVAHCEAGPNSCPQCHKESRPTYGSEEVRKLREVIESQAKIIESNKPPPWFNAVENILKEYGLQAIDFVADFKAAIVDAEQHAAQRQWAVFCGGCRKEWSVLYQHPGKSICNECEAKLREKNTGETK